MIERSRADMKEAMRPRAALMMAALGLAVALSVAPAANAAFPGSNGRILFTSNLAGGLSEIFSMKPNGEKLKRLTRNKVGDADAVYSPSGRKIAFIRGEKRQAELWTMNANGSGKRRLTNNSFADASPAWSPDGQRVVFRSSRIIAPDVEPNLDIWVINADGTGETRLTSAASFGDDDPVFSPDGTKIAYHSLRGVQSDIFVMNADGTNSVALAPSPSDEFDVDWSPSGTKLVFASDRNRNTEIYAMNADGTGLKRLTKTSRANEALPVFSPDGARIAFQRRLISASGAITRADDVFVMRSGGKGVKRLTRSRDYDGRPDWQPR
jgi:Tol biopolymer transport system component